MKFKVLYIWEQGGGGNPDVMTLGSFFRKSEAQSSAADWFGLGSGRYAYWWDGTRWVLTT